MAEKQKWFHAIGICGKATANVALMFKRMGWFVTGSDSQFFPPASTLLEKNEIPTVEGYHFSHLTREFWEERIKNEELRIKDIPDLCLVVESASSKNKEYLYAKKQGIDVRPYSQILGEYLVKPESIVVIGTAGKTTTTALLVSITQALGLNPSYMIGADVIDFDDSLINTDSNWSILEGDEYHSPELAKGAKFLEYRPKYLIITKIGWEHQDIFPTQERYVEEFHKAVELIPDDGIIVAKAGDKNIDKALRNAKCKIIRYQFSDVSSQSSGISSQENTWTVDKRGNGLYAVRDGSGECILDFKTKLIGEYNLENILATVALVSNLPARSLPIDLVSKGTSSLRVMEAVIENFKGPKKRLEFLYRDEDLIIVDDFGVAPERAQNSLRTLHDNFPDFKIFAIFEPNSGSRLKDKALFNKLYKDTFKNAHVVIIPDLSTSNPELISTKETVEYLNSLGIHAIHVENKDLKEHFLEKIKSKDDAKALIVFFSSYRLTETANNLADTIKNFKV